MGKGAFRVLCVEVLRMYISNTRIAQEMETGTGTERARARLEPVSVSKA